MIESVQSYSHQKKHNGVVVASTAAGTVLGGLYTFGHYPADIFVQMAEHMNKMGSDCIDYMDEFVNLDQAQKVLQEGAINQETYDKLSKMKQHLSEITKDAKNSMNNDVPINPEAIKKADALGGMMANIPESVQKTLKANNVFNNEVGLAIKENLSKTISLCLRKFAAPLFACSAIGAGLGLGIGLGIKSFLSKD